MFSEIFCKLTPLLPILQITKAAKLSVFQFMILLSNNVEKIFQGVSNG